MSKPIKIYEETFTARNFNTTPLTVSNLLGDTYDYHIMIKSDDVSTDSSIRLRFNGDTGSNYSNYLMLGAVSTASASVSTGTSTQLNSGFANSVVNSGLVILSITGVSGRARHTNAIFTGNSRISVNDSYWHNTANEITSMQISGTASATGDAHIIIYRTLKEASNDWEFISKLSWSAESIEKSFTGLLGDTDKVYRLEWDGGNQSVNIQLNNDTTTYARQMLRNLDGAIISETSTTLNSINTNGIRSTVIINAETGHKRLTVSSASKTTFSRQSESANWYDETATEITTIDCTPTGPITGTAKLYRQKKKGNDFFNLPFKLVKEVVVSGNFSAGHTFSGLLGDSTKLYKVSGLFSTVGNDLRMQLNNNTGSVYFHQSLTNASASSSTTTFALLCSASVSKVASFELYIYPLSGETRPCLLRVVRGENTIEFKTFVYNQSATELTDIKIFASSTGTCTGNLKLYKLG